jgi:RNA polymerase sigma-70 factor, ECF subfamily
MTLSVSCYGTDNLWWNCRVKPAQLPVIETVMEATSPNQNRDAALLARISQGDRVAFSEFYDLYSGLFFSIAVKVLHDLKEAEDVVQDAFIQIWEKAGTFDPRLGKASSWGMTFVRNKAIDRIRASQRRVKLVESATAETASTLDSVSSVNESVSGREKAEIIRSAVTGLPMDQRQAIELAFFAGLTQNEISDRLHEPLGTIKARIRRGMLKLREKLEGCV